MIVIDAVSSLLFGPIRLPHGPNQLGLEGRGASHLPRVGRGLVSPTVARLRTRTQIW